MKTFVCRHCEVECEYSEPRMKKGRILNHDFYYAYRFKCPKCNRWYYPDEAKIYYAEQANRISLKTPKSVLEILKETEAEFAHKSDLKRSRQLLWRFHKFFLDNPNAFYNKEEKLIGLRFLAEVKIPPETSRQQRREEFDIKKQTEGWKPHINDDKCFVCFAKSQIRHHMIQLQNGGRNTFNNITNLCNNCHADIHPWLKTKH